jgi:asparagine synthase (glutamine-hydrolysing)
MCGIAGIFGGNLNTQTTERVLEKMGEAISHRGPDDSGIWFDPSTRIGLAHQRLSILDLSVAGHQPMHSPNQRYAMVFNGEIYNHFELRNTLEKQLGASMSWRGHSDTETLLACIDFWGFEITLKQTVGMFAIALWDKQERALYLARDRMGEKPLYYGLQAGLLVFSSELKGIRQHPSFTFNICRDALSEYLRYSYVPAPRSIYKDIYKLSPGTYLKLNLDNLESAQIKSQVSFWSFKDVTRQGQETRFEGDDAEAVTALESGLTKAIQLQQLSDVPVGAFLSGGVDSSLIVSLMQAQSCRPVNTFTIGFEEKEFNEAEYAAVVARHLGTQHHEVYLSGADALRVIPKLGHIYDEPFADASQIPTQLVCDMSHGSVSVALSGDAGDELFGGYNRYLLAGRLWSRMSKVPRPLRQGLASGMSQLSPQVWALFYGATKGLMPNHWQVSQPADKIQKLIQLLAVQDEHALYKNVVSQWKSPQDIVFGGNSPVSMLAGDAGDMPAMGFEEWMMLMDTQTYLPDDILVKTDRAAMSVGLETRVPLLDHRIVEFAARLPLKFKIRDGQGKWILRQILYKHVPREMIERPKMGFSIPIDRWLRGPLRNWAEDLLDESRIRKEGYLNAAPIRQKWIEHLSGKRNWQHQLWNVLMFQAWLAAQKSTS